MTGRTSGKTAEHVFVLDFVAVGLDPGEELIDAYDRVLVPVDAVPVPDSVLYFLREVAVWFEDRNIVPFSHLDEVILEPAHLVSPPACDRAVVNALALVRHDQVLADSDYLSQSATHRAGPEGTVE